jgi:hypothetical protein
MVIETKVLHYLCDSFISAVFEDGSDDGFECGSDHLGRLLIRSGRDEDALIDAMVEPTISQGVITQKIIAERSPVCG